MAYATVADLERRWHPLSDDDRAVAEVLLEDAALLIDAQTCIDLNDPLRARAAAYASVNMVQRALASRGQDSFGISQQTISADIYSQSMTFANPAGDLYMSGMEKRLLGISSAYAKTLRPRINPRKVRPHDCR